MLLARVTRKEKGNETMMNNEKLQILAKYVQEISSSSINYDFRGKYIDAVYRFLATDCEVSRRGYRNWCKSHAEEMLYMPWMRKAICTMLAQQGIGFRLNKAGGGKNRNIDKIQKRDIRQTDIVNGFLNWLQNERDYSPNTLRIYSFSILDFYSYFDEFSQEGARRYVAALEDKNYSPKTIRLRITSLEKLGIYLKKPIRLKRPKLKMALSVENVPNKSEYNKLLAYCDGYSEKWAFIIRLMATTGCRVSELIQLTYEHILAGSCELKGKGDKYRRFFFSRDLQSRAKGKSGYVCVNRYGGQMSIRGVEESLKDIGRKCGIPKEKMHPHAFRHFFAKMYLERTKDVVSLSELLGHSSVDITRIYLQKSYDEQKRDFNKTVNW